MGLVPSGGIHVRREHLTWSCTDSDGDRHRDRSAVLPAEYRVEPSLARAVRAQSCPSTDPARWPGAVVLLCAARLPFSPTAVPANSMPMGARAGSVAHQKRHDCRDRRQPGRAAVRAGGEGYDVINRSGARRRARLGSARRRIDIAKIFGPRPPACRRRSSHGAAGPLGRSGAHHFHAETPHRQLSSTWWPTSIRQPLESGGFLV